MASNAKKAIARVKLEGVIFDLLLMTNTENVYVDENTTLAQKLTDMLTAISGKAEASSVTQQIRDLKQELMGEDVSEAMDTFKELADFIADNQDAIDLLNQAISGKAEASALKSLQDSLGNLATKSEVTEGMLAATLLEKVNAAAQGNHSHGNKDLLDTYDQTNANIKAAIEKMHDHSNKTVLDDIGAAKVAAWDGKARVYGASETVSLAKNEVYIQLV